MDTLHARFRAAAMRYPDRTALRSEHRELTYAELDHTSDEVAADLARAGVEPGSLVALRLDRGLSMPVAVLGVLKHGCGYVPVDPAYPADRQDYMLADSGARFVVGSDDPDDLRPGVVDHGAPPSRHRLPADVAYVIYTSGSTGRPKGVVVGHRHVLALMDAAAPLFPLGPEDALTQFHSFCFDVSVWEVWGALLCGGTLVVTRLAHARDPATLARWLAEARATVLNQVPTVFGYLVRALEDEPVPLPHLRHVILAGEAVDLGAVRRWRQTGCAPGAQVVNMYGPTETTVFTTFRVLTDADQPERWGGRTPIGPVLPHLRSRLVDEHLGPVPDGELGELLVAGAGVSYGYLGRPELTAERFVRLPDVDGLWYRTGDWVLQTPDGDLVYAGRRDDQVKIRGFRVELGEIETVLREHRDVVACAVTVGRNRLGEQSLAAHYVPRQEGADLTRALRQLARAKLPAQLVPARFRALPELPLTGSGKIDRKALAEQAA